MKSLLFLTALFALSAVFAADAKLEIATDKEAKAKAKAPKLKPATEENVIFCSVIMPPMAIPNEGGRIAFIKDPQGVATGLAQYTRKG
jgi:hypothetical protein